MGSSSAGKPKRCQKFGINDPHYPYDGQRSHPPGIIHQSAALCLFNFFSGLIETSLGLPIAQPRLSTPHYPSLEGSSSVHAGRNHQRVTGGTTSPSLRQPGRAEPPLAASGAGLTWPGPQVQQLPGRWGRRAAGPRHAPARAEVERRPRARRRRAPWRAGGAGKAEAAGGLLSLRRGG